jgi:hypothetical protein
MDRAEKEEERRRREGGAERAGEGEEDSDDEADDALDWEEPELSEEAMADAGVWLHGEFWERIQAAGNEEDEHVRGR